MITKDNAIEKERQSIEEIIEEKQYRSHSKVSILKEIEIGIFQHMPPWRDHLLLPLLYGITTPMYLSGHGRYGQFLYWNKNKLSLFPEKPRGLLYTIPQ